MMVTLNPTIRTMRVGCVKRTTRSPWCVSCALRSCFRTARSWGGSCTATPAFLHGGGSTTATPTVRCVSRTLLILLAVIVLAGCGERGPERIVVSGTVTYNGKPLPNGMIRFLPTAQSAAPVAGANIVNGQYRVDSRGGVPVGPATVQIEAYRRTKVALPPGAPRPPNGIDEVVEQYIPRKYNAGTELKITIPSGSRAITQDFDLRD
jgi:hypothetical protein